MSEITDLPVVVIGAGPTGLAAAAHLSERGLPFRVLEAGPAAGASVGEWGHIQLFSPWGYNTDPAAVRLLEQTGWQAPDPEALPTGAELVADYLEPLAAHDALAPYIRYQAPVAAIGRQGIDRVRTADREKAPFVVRVADGAEITARAVIDASGTWRTPNPLGAGGLPAHGEAAAAALVDHALPDVLGADRSRHAGRHTVVVGAGHSAANTLLALAELASQEPDTRITWAIRAADPKAAYGGQEADQLAARGALGSGLQMLVDTGRVELLTAFRTTHVHTTAGVITLVSRAPDGTEQTVTADRVVAATGFRPDPSVTGELRLDLDPILQAPRALATLIDPNKHSCGTVYPHGVDELCHPEEGYYAVGMKSYGRAPTFLLATGYEQVRSITAALAGDWDAARDVQLELPETGVCSVTAGSETLALRLGLTRDQHTELLKISSQYVPTTASAGDAVLAAAGDLNIDPDVALQLAAYAADQLDPTPADESASCGTGSC